MGQEGDTPGYIISWKKCQDTLNRIYHYEVHASHWNPNTVSDGKAKKMEEKKGKSSPSNLTTANLSMTAQTFFFFLLIRSIPPSVEYFQQIPEATIKLFHFYCLADTSHKLTLELDYTTFGHTK